MLYLAELLNLSYIEQPASSQPSGALELNHGVIIIISIGIVVSLLIGKVATTAFAKYVNRKSKSSADGTAVPSNFLIGTAERLFFMVGIAFDISGIMIAMMGWVTIKMASGWNQTKLDETINIKAKRFRALLTNLCSMFFAMAGGLILRYSFLIEQIF